MDIPTTPGSLEAAKYGLEIVVTVGTIALGIIGIAWRVSSRVTGLGAVIEAMKMSITELKHYRDSHGEDHEGRIKRLEKERDEDRTVLNEIARGVEKINGILEGRRDVR